MDVMTTTTIPVEGATFWGWFDGYLTAMIGVSVFGGQITFTVILSDIPDPEDIMVSPSFQRQTVRTFLAISWVLFAFTLALSLLVKMLMSDHLTRGWIEDKIGVRMMHHMTALTIILLEELPVVAFLFLALSVTAYVPIVGWIGVGSISLFAAFLAVLWRVVLRKILQLTLRGRSARDPIFSLWPHTMES